MSGGRTEGNVAASPSDYQRLQFSNEMIPYLKDYIEKQSRGTVSPDDISATNSAIQELRKQAGVMGVSPGDPRMVESIRKTQEGLTKPSGKNDVVSLALQLYGMAPQMPTNQYQKYHPGGMDYLSAIIGGISALYGGKGSTQQYSGNTGVQQRPSTGYGGGAPSFQTWKGY